MAKIKYKKISPELLKMATMGGKKDNSLGASLNDQIEPIKHYQVSVKRLIPYHKQARKRFDEVEIENLSFSIKEHGVRQPLTIIQSLQDEKTFEVVSGERRLRAAIKAGLSKVPCILISDHLLAEEVALVENIQREDLHPIELGEAYMQLLNSRPEMKQVDLSKKIGISSKVISEHIQYARLPSDIKEKLISENINDRGLFRRLVKSDNPFELVFGQLKSKQHRFKEKSILRIKLINDEYHVQSNALKFLTIEQKNNLKETLNEFIDSF
jgi:ParB family transcriptional regulator, chromosome partitioning protein